MRKSVPMILALMMAIVAGCTSAPTVVSRPQLGRTEAAPLGGLLQVSSVVPTRLSIEARAPGHGFSVSWPDWAMDHEVPVLGLKPDLPWTIDVFLDDGTRSGRVGRIPFETDPLPDDFPTMEVRTDRREEAEPGYRLATVRRVTVEGRHFIVAWDIRDLEVAWYAVAPLNFGDVRRTSQGTLLGIRGQAEETDFLLRTLTRWTPDPSAAVDVQLPTEGVHHELFPMPDGSLMSLSRYAHWSEAYPSSLDAPTVRDEAARLVASRVVRFDRDGTLQWQVPLGDLLDDGRIGMSSLEASSFGPDWLHANAVIPTDDGGAIVSVRHQDALVKVTEGGELAWILGDPAGWIPPYGDYLLRGEPGLTWPYHPHAPAFANDGTLVVFDNHNFGHTPYTAPPAEPWSSRVVGYRVDDVAGTVEQVWEFRPDGLPIQSPKMGDADPLPETGHVLANFGWIQEGDVDEAGIPDEVSMRLVEFEPTEGRTVLDLWFRAPNDGGPPGVRSYRSEVIPSLYADGVTVEVW